jgi:predicted HAD superfamily Cof-like phosphohydrolase
MSLDLIQLWHEKARQFPSDADFQVQLGCHFEEIAEMFDVLRLTKGDERLFNVASMAMYKLANELKQGKLQVAIVDRHEFLDSLCDQIVTAVGAGHCTGMNVVEGCRSVNTSNWSKFGPDGEPIRDSNGKILKGSRYQPPALDGLY